MSTKKFPRPLRHVLRAALGCALALAGGLVVIPAAPVLAATQHVTSCADAGANSLRGKIGSAGVGDTIVFDQDCAGASVIVLSTTLTIATNNLTIDGTGHNVVVDGGCTFSSGSCASGTGATVFTVNSGVTARLSALTIQHGNAGSGIGGGIGNAGTLTVTNSTIASNSTDGFGIGGGIINLGSGLTLTNTIVDGNSATIIGPDLASNGNLTSGGHNLFGTTSGTTLTLGVGDRVNPTPLLGAFGGHGGPTETIPLLTSSPAIGHGDPAICGTTGVGMVNGVDQRGFLRQVSVCSIGAFEAQPVPPNVLPPPKPPGPAGVPPSPLPVRLPQGTTGGPGPDPLPPPRPCGQC